jgi:hypothetical protein
MACVLASYRHLDCPLFSKLTSTLVFAANAQVSDAYQVCAQPLAAPRHRAVPQSQVQNLSLCPAAAAFGVNARAPSGASIKRLSILSHRRRQAS